MTATPRVYSWRYLTPLYLGATLNPVNSSLLATALVPIALGLHVSVGATAILVTSLYLASAIAQPTAGKLAEEFGPRRIFLIGIVLVGIGGIVGALGNDLATLVVARVLIGIGTSAGYPSAMLLIRKRAEAAGLPRPPGGVLGGIQIAATVTIALGLPIGGVLVDAWGWRTTFLVNIPFALVAFAAATAWIPHDAPLARGRRFTDIAERIDLIGIVAFAAAVTALLGFLFSLPNPTWSLLAFGIVVGAMLVAWELRARRPFIDFRLLATNGGLSRTYLRFTLTTLCVYCVLYGLAQWIEAARGASSREAGLLMLPMSLVSMVATQMVSRRNLVRGPLVAASAAALLGSIAIVVLDTTSSIALIIGITILFGMTLGPASSSNQLALYADVTTEQLGTASGLFRTAGYFGSIASSALIGVVFHGGVTDHGLHVIGAIMAAVSIGALVLTLADHRLTATSVAVPAAVAPAQPAV